jgi:hypothetical protein
LRIHLAAVGQVLVAVDEAVLAGSAAGASRAGHLEVRRIQPWTGHSAASAVHRIGIELGAFPTAERLAIVAETSGKKTRTGRLTDLALSTFIAALGAIVLGEQLHLAAVAHLVVAISSVGKDAFRLAALSLAASIVHIFWKRRQAWPCRIACDTALAAIAVIGTQVRTLPVAFVRLSEAEVRTHEAVAGVGLRRTLVTAGSAVLLIEIEVRFAAVRRVVVAIAPEELAAECTCAIDTRPSTVIRGVQSWAAISAIAAVVVIAQEVRAAREL